MSDSSIANNLITEHIDIWTSTVKTNSASGRGSSKKIDLYGIKKLRELILELAVRGKLVPQDPSDEPASKLLERIAAEKAQLVKEKKIKKPKALPEISEEEKPFELPEGWEWVRLGLLGNIFNGNSISARVKEQKYMISEGLPFIATKDVGYGYSSFDYDNGVKIPIGEEKFKIARKNSILVCAEGGSAGKKCGIAEQDICFGNKLFANELHCNLDPKFILFNYLAPYFYTQFSQSMTGIIGGIATSKFVELLIPISPLPEQHRIVAKVDELMALCDQLEQQTESQIEAQQTLVSVLLETLSTAKSHNELMQNWQRLSEHFDTLFTTEQSIDQLKQTILQLAVMGRLVPQDPTDEPASKLLERIAAEKAQLIADKKIKKQKALPPISDDEKPFELPDGWEFSYMQDLCYLITDGTHQTPKYTDSGRPFISAQCVKPFRFMPENCRYVSEDDYQGYIKNRKPEIGDILLSRVGAGIGEAALINTNLEFAIYVSTGLLKTYQDKLSSEYLVVWLNSPLGRSISEKNTLGKGVSQGNLNLSLIRSFVVSLPPRQEQHRIVAKVDELMAICDQLKSKVNQSQQTQLHLTDAIVEQVV